MKFLEKYIDASDAYTINRCLANGWYIYHDGPTLVIMRKDYQSPFGTVLAQRLFKTLEKGFAYGEYTVVTDGCYCTTIWADNDDEAIRIFENGGYKK